MRFDKELDVFQGLQTGWKPTILSPAMMDLASSDAALWAKKTSEFDRFDVPTYNEAASWARTQGIALFHSATGKLGLPSSVYDSIGDALLPLIINPPDDLKELQDAMLKTGIGLVTDALAAVPVVGPICGAVVDLVLTIIQLRKKPPEEIKRFFAPITKYNAQAEEIAMNNALPILRTSDWTSLFLPRLGNDVRVEPREAGACPAWVMLSSEQSKNAGFIPGSQEVAGPVQAFVTQRESGGLNGAWCDHDRVEHRDIGDFYPSLAKLLTAVSGQVQTPTAALWSVRPEVILSEWETHLEIVIKKAKKWWSGDKIKGSGLEGLSSARRQRVVQALVAPYFGFKDKNGFSRGMLVSWEPGKESKMLSVVDAVVRPWCDIVQRRQLYYLGTTVVAYADPTSAAFSALGMRTKLEDMRKLLLESPYRREVDLMDVIDTEYSEALFQSTIGSTLKDPSAPASPGLPSPLESDSGAPELPTGPNPISPFGRDIHPGGLTASHLVALGLAGGAGLLLWRYHRKAIQ